VRLRRAGHRLRRHLTEPVRLRNPKAADSRQLNVVRPIHSGWIASWLPLEHSLHAFPPTLTIFASSAATRSDRATERHAVAARLAHAGDGCGTHGRSTVSKSGCGRHRKPTHAKNSAALRSRTAGFACTTLSSIFASGAHPLSVCEGAPALTPAGTERKTVSRGSQRTREPAPPASRQLLDAPELAGVLLGPSAAG
jgi:hypothetical protein